MQNLLYVLGEASNELNLYCLDAGTGKLVWAQPLGLCEMPLTSDLNRRITALVPTYSNGVMICPTNSGKIIAVDVFNRCLLWAQTYNQSPNWQIPGAMMNRRVVFNNGNQVSDGSQTRWADGTAAVAGGKVVVGPADGDELLCYDLLTGESVWRLSRNDMPDRSPLFVASVDESGVVVAGRNSLFGIDLLKKSVQFSIDYAGGQPSGRGYRSGNFYYLPLNTAEVIKVDSAAKKIASRSKLRKGVVPGNLIVHRGQIVSVGDERVAVLLLAGRSPRLGEGRFGKIAKRSGRALRVRRDRIELGQAAGSDRAFGQSLRREAR
ncbi:MAG: PQQ-binding-like beta-propeller repeat protein [Pirellulales bacterium]